MPKSLSTIQNQIAGCERSISEALAQCAAQAGDKDFQFNFSLNSFVSGITTFDLDNTSESITKVIGLFTECEKIIALEKKRRVYTKELKKILKAREKKETVKRLTMQHAFKTKAAPLKIPSLPSTQDDMQE
ncbi:hypothetical protein OS493_039500 [Desmophyllum pertusum]|uniref:Uncharacterized protein n=1 Tax=Desmophyllum pertusum TaxID=174260 RepID=A0A9X0CDC5_9CNID|nr:hypothetical protein OS493_039500 [Desmophyllum pertusum]